MKLNDDDMKLVSQRYDLRGDGQTICYRAFCEAINRPIDPNNMNVDLASQVKINGPQSLYVNYFIIIFSFRMITV